MENRYDIIKLIHKDAAGGVYLAEQRESGQKVDFRNFDVGMGAAENWKDEFRAFATKLAAVSHAHIAPMVEADTNNEDGPYNITAHIDGEMLDELLQDGPLTPQEVRQMAEDLLRALQAIHAQGMVHGALSTGSIRMMPAGQGQGGVRRASIVDFGTAGLVAITKGPRVYKIDPVFSPPELHKNDADERSDLFMLGQICYTAMAGGHPFAGMKRDECRREYKGGKFPPLMEFVPGIHESLSQWIGFLTQADPSQRYATAENALEGLGSVTMTRPSHAAGAVAPTMIAAAPRAATAVRTAAPIVQPAKSSAAPWVIVIVLLLLVGGGAWFASQSGDETPTATAKNESEPEKKSAKKSPLKPKPKSSAKPSTKTPASPAKVAKVDKEKPPEKKEEEPIHVPEGKRIKAESVKVLKGLSEGGRPAVCEFVGLPVLDAYLAAGAPVSSKSVRLENESYFQGVTADPSFTEYKSNKPLILFRTPKKFFPSNSLTGSEHDATKGAGWNVTFRTPDDHADDMLVAFYLHVENCELALKVTDPSSGKKYTFPVKPKEAGVVLARIRIPDAKPNTLYTIRVEAAEVEATGFKMGFKGCVIMEDHD